MYQSADVVVDLGGNRGAFASLMTTRASKIVLVECGAEYKNIIGHNLELNQFQNYFIEEAFIGEGGAFSSESRSITMSELVEKYQLETVNLLKMDIEGSEFFLFQDDSWLVKVESLCLELHPDWGETSLIIDALAKNGFSYRGADENLVEMFTFDRASFLYAWRQRILQ